MSSGRRCFAERTLPGCSRARAVSRRPQSRSASRLSSDRKGGRCSGHASPIPTCRGGDLSQAPAGRLRDGTATAWTPQYPDNDRLLLRAADNAGHRAVRKAHPSADQIRRQCLTNEATSVTTASQKVRPAKGKVRSLPLNLWPEADRNAWNAACRPDARLKRGGLAGHLKPVTREDHARNYGCFLDFLDRGGLLRSDGPAAANVTVDSVDAYIVELKERVSSVTVFGSISKLRRTARFI